MLDVFYFIKNFERFEMEVNGIGIFLEKFLENFKIVIFFKCKIFN